MPDVVGPAEATRPQPRSSSAGFEVVAQHARRPTAAPPGTVVAQTPDAERDRCGSGSTVTIIVAEAPPPSRPRPRPPTPTEHAAADGHRRPAVGLEPGHVEAPSGTTGARPVGTRSTASGSPQVDQPVGEQPVAALGEHRLGVELHALERQVAVPQRHHDAARGPAGDLQLGRDVSGSTASEW